MDGPRTIHRRTSADEVLLVVLRLATGVSIAAADEVGVLSTVQLRAVTVLSQRPGTNLGDPDEESQTEA